MLTPLLLLSETNLSVYHERGSCQHIFVLQYPGVLSGLSPLKNSIPII